MEIRVIYNDTGVEDRRVEYRLEIGEEETVLLTREQYKVLELLLDKLIELDEHRKVVEKDVYTTVTVAEIKVRIEVMSFSSRLQDAVHYTIVPLPQ